MKMGGLGEQSILEVGPIGGHTSNEGWNGRGSNRPGGDGGNGGIRSIRGTAEGNRTQFQVSSEEQDNSGGVSEQEISTPSSFRVIRSRVESVFPVPAGEFSINTQTSLFPNAAQSFVQTHRTAIESHPITTPLPFIALF
jgi:hypothetical protein